MANFGQFTKHVEAMHTTLVPHEVEPHISDMVTMLSKSTWSWGTSPVGSVNVIAGTLVAAATGMAGAIGSGNLSFADVTDREDLQIAVAALRGAADVFDAIVKAGRQ